MNIQRIFAFLTLAACGLAMTANARAAGIVTGTVTIEDQSSSTKSVSTSGQQSVSPDRAVSGAKGSAANVIVYIAPAASAGAAPKKQPMSIGQEGCHLSPAVLQLGFVPVAAYTGQSVNQSDEEIIPAKCEAASAGRKYFVVQKTSRFAVTAENGKFSLDGLLPGKYTIVAWDEYYGAQSQEVAITGNETVPANFVFRPKSKI